MRNLNKRSKENLINSAFWLGTSFHDDTTKLTWKCVNIMQRDDQFL